MAWRQNSATTGLLAFFHPLKPTIPQWGELRWGMDLRFSPLQWSRTPAYAGLAVVVETMRTLG